MEIRGQKSQDGTGSRRSDWRFTPAVKWPHFGQWTLRKPTREAHINLQNWNCQRTWNLGPSLDTRHTTSNAHVSDNPTPKTDWNRCNVGTGKLVGWGCLRVPQIWCNENRSTGETTGQILDIWNQRAKARATEHCQRIWWTWKSVGENHGIQTMVGRSTIKIDHDPMEQRRSHERRRSGELCKRLVAERASSPSSLPPCIQHNPPFPAEQTIPLR